MDVCRKVRFLNSQEEAEKNTPDVTSTDEDSFDTDSSLVREEPKIVIKRNYQYVIPKRGIFTNSDVAKWLRSEAYFLLMTLINDVNKAVRCKPIGGIHHVSPVIRGLVKIMETIEKWASEFHCKRTFQSITEGYRKWHAHLDDKCSHLIDEALGGEFPVAAGELQVYLVDSFGSPAELKYGYHNEIAFLMFIICLFRIGALREDDKTAVGLILCDRYVELIRKLKSYFRLESYVRIYEVNSIYSSDDLHFVPFIWGTSQLIDHPWIKPSVIVDNEDLIKMYSKEYVFLSCLQDIIQARMEPFNEDEDIDKFWNICMLSSWEEVNECLLQLYHREVSFYAVLDRLSVIRFLMFGSLIPLKHRKWQKKPDNPLCCVFEEIENAITRENSIDCDTA